MKKAASEATDSVANGDDDLSQQDSATKKRGRPKNPEGTSSAKKPKVDADPLKKSGRGRGRPPKPGGPTVKPKKPPVYDKDGNVIKRGRGRPRKDEGATTTPTEKKKKAGAGDSDDSS